MNTPWAIITAALIISATVMFTFRYSYHTPSGILFNQLTGDAYFEVPQVPAQMLPRPSQ
jgi:hypothetical protein